MNVLLVVTPDFAVNPVPKRNPDDGADTNADADDDVSAFAALLRDRRRGGAASSTSEWVR